MITLVAAHPFSRARLLISNAKVHEHVRNEGEVDDRVDH